MSYPPHHPYQTDNGHGAPSQGPVNDNRRASPHPHSPPTAQVGNVSRTSRSLSTTTSTRTVAPGQAQPDSYRAGQYWEQDPRYVQLSHAQPYNSSQSQPASSPIQDQLYHQSIEPHIRPPEHPPPHYVPQYSQPRRSVSHQPGHAQQAQYQYGEQDYPPRSPQQQPPYPNYQQLQAPPVDYQQLQSPSTQYQQQQPSPTHTHYPQQPPYQQHWQQHSGPGNQLQQDPYLTRTTDPNTPLSGPVEEQVRCHCGTTYLARGRSGSRYGTQPGNPGGYLLPPCTTCGSHPAPYRTSLQAGQPNTPS